MDKEILGSNKDEHGNTYDFFININDSIFVDVEVNTDYFKTAKNKSFLYYSRLISSSINTGKEYKSFSDKKYIQLNLNSKDKKEDFGEDCIYPYSTKTQSVYMSNAVIYLRYLDYYNRLYYNEDIKKEESDYFLAMLTSKSFVELYKMLDSFLEEDIKQRIMRDVIRMSMKISFNEQELKNLEKQVEMDTKETYINIGIEEKSIEVAKSMLIKGMSIDDIVDITKLSKEKIEELSKEVNR